MSEISSATGKLLALSMLRGVGPATLRKMANLPDFRTCGRDDLALQFPANSAILRDNEAWNQALEEADGQAELAERYCARILSPLDQDYPSLLAGIKDDPFLLYVRGALARDQNKSVAVIGTREPTEHGKVIARRISEYLVDRGWSIVSGLALGCDAIAHQSALDARGHTVAVMAHGLHTVAPKSNRRLAESILNNGGSLVSEYPFGTEPRPEFFVKRDRIQAGLAQGVVMVQSDLKGGSLHASRAALHYGRWLATPYPTEQDRYNRESKIQANVTISSGTEQERTALLRCPADALKRIIVLHSRADYDKLLTTGEVSRLAVPPIQGGLL